MKSKGFEEEEFEIKREIESARSVINAKEDTPKRTQRAPKKEEEVTTKAVGKEIVSVLINVAVCVVVVFLITHFIGQRTVVSGSSMEDTLSDGDNLIVDKISYRLGEPERFDVIVFPYQYEEDVYYIKRIIGLPYETVRIDEEGNIYINGEILQESYGTEVIADPGIAINEISLGEDEYFVLGDNRNNSTDSRFETVGNIQGHEITGRAWLRVYPFSEFGLVENLV